MIKFFRHIRKSLIEKNQMGKYFKYAIGEILLVVIGILIALQINNWNENKKTQGNVNTFLSSLESDLNNDLLTITEIIEVQENRLKGLKKLISLGNKSKQNEILENNKNYQIDIGRNWTFFPVAGAYKTASGTGMIENLENDTLKSEIVNLYEYYYKRINYVGQINDQRSELLEWESRKYIDNMITTQRYDGNGLSDKDFLDQLGFVMRFTGVYVGFANKTKEAIEKTIRTIKIERKEK
ncbi:DUF6090 family protein [uncultured Psychroserpens sp.]|uniref:DUF6090 family protein n=1 Tax=uncultured Psychroserpens sp. TaxID=255436 RepID=UPI0026067886|nr:DUF6090 family protein [uncultured Psychroserpens sp.]